MKPLVLLFLSNFIICQTSIAAPKTVFVQLFEWSWKDIATECEYYLGPNGFAAVQVSPPQEHLTTANSFWWERYQPVSYNLLSRSGNEDEFKDMVRRCNNAGVDIYVDAVINHMSGFESATGFSGQAFTHFNYKDLYNYDDFHHCNRNGDDNIVNFYDRYELFNCELLNLADLNTSSEKVRNNIVNYLNKLTDFGVKGFRVDAAKHIDPQDLSHIQKRIKNSAYIIQELIINNLEPIHYDEYSSIGDMTVFSYSYALGDAFKQNKLGGLFNISQTLPRSDQAIVFIDNHDLQRMQHSNILVYQNDPITYRLAQVFLLTYPYAYPQIFSGYKFSNFDQGPPVDASRYTKPVLDKNLNCVDAWTCEHRLPEVTGLVKFRNQTDSAFYASNWWSNGTNQIAFSRGALGFVAINNSQDIMLQKLQTSLPQGKYCNLTESINTKNSNCKVKYIVDENSQINLKLEPQTALVLLKDEKIK